MTPTPPERTSRREGVDLGSHRFDTTPEGHPPRGRPPVNRPVAQLHSRSLPTSRREGRRYGAVSPALGDPFRREAVGA